MATVTIREQLLTSLDDGPWLTYLALADEAEEAGDPHLAAGWRWLKREMRHPDYHPHSDRWGWLYHATSDFPSDWSCLPTPVRAIVLCFPGEVGCGISERRTCSEALLLAAQALAVLSQRGQLEGPK